MTDNTTGKGTRPAGGTAKSQRPAAGQGGGARSERAASAPAGATGNPPASGHQGNSTLVGTMPMPAFLVDLARNAPAMMWTFTLTTFLSALLLFAIQPMFAKTVLPVLGGSPSVWSVSVFFF